MNEESTETQDITFRDSHPWLLLQQAEQEEESVDEVIRDTLEELRFA